MPNLVRRPAAPARTDEDTPLLPAAAEAGLPTRSWVRRRGAVLVAGGLTWVATSWVWGLDNGGVTGRLADLASLCFQVGVMALLTVMIRTRATGTSRFSRGLLRVEVVLLAVAMVNSLLAATVADMSNPVQAVTDAFWPLSMLGMWVAGIRTALAGRWRGALRFWPCVAEAYFPLVMGSILLFGAQYAGVASGTVVLLGYCVVGALLVLRPGLTGARRD